MLAFKNYSSINIAMKTKRDEKNEIRLIILLLNATK